MFIVTTHICTCTIMTIINRQSPSISWSYFRNQPKPTTNACVCVCVCEWVSECIKRCEHDMVVYTLIDDQHHDTPQSFQLSNSICLSSWSFFLLCLFVCFPSSLSTHFRWLASFSQPASVIDACGLTKTKRLKKIVAYSILHTYIQTGMLYACECVVWLDCDYYI